MPAPELVAAWREYSAWHRKGCPVECERCGGEGHQGVDEAGYPYSCYSCGNTGWMLSSPFPVLLP